MVVAFLLEQGKPKIDDLSESLKKVHQWVKDEPNYELWKTFMKWIVRYFQDSNSPSHTDLFDDADFNNKSKEEITNMIETLSEKFIEQGRIEGRQEGEAKGQVLGLLEGMNLIYPGILERYKKRVDNAQTEVEFHSLKEEILREVASLKKD